VSGVNRDVDLDYISGTVPNVYCIAHTVIASERNAMNGTWMHRI